MNKLIGLSQDHHKQQMLPQEHHKLHNPAVHRKQLNLVVHRKQLNPVVHRKQQANHSPVKQQQNHRDQQAAASAIKKVSWLTKTTARNSIGALAMERAATPSMTLIVQKELHGVKSWKHVIMLINPDVPVNQRQHHPHQQKTVLHRKQHHPRPKQLQHRKRQASPY